jgi:hypothetical protein
LKRLFQPALFCLFLFSAINISWLPKTNPEPVIAAEVATTTEAEAASLYQSMGLEEKGLSEKAFACAYKGFRYLQQRQQISEPYLTICDFSQSSNNKRLYIVDMENNTLVLNTYVAHGRNSGAEFATRFSNKNSSLQSSLGFYITQNTYFGEHGLSLKIAGVEPGYNSNAMQRAVVVHGADYIGESWLHHSDYMGRSFGCPAVPARESARIINTIKDGTCLFIYHPSASYLKGSRILNS